MLENFGKFPKTGKKRGLFREALYFKRRAAINSVRLRRGYQQKEKRGAPERFEPFVQLSLVFLVVSLFLFCLLSSVSISFRATTYAHK